MSSTDMAKIKQELPPHCQVKKRSGGAYYDVYFMPHPKDRPDGWNPTIHLGRTDKKSTAEIIKAAAEVYEDYLDFRGNISQGKKPEDMPGSLPQIIKQYKESRFWTDLAPKTQVDYGYYLDDIAKWSAKSGHAHLKHMTVGAITKWLNKYEDTPVKQRRAKTTLSMIYKVAIREGHVDSNPVASITLYRRKTEKRALVIWEEKHVNAFVAKAEEMGLPSLGRALIMGLETAQRRGDVLRMQKPRDYDPKAGRLKFKQSKTKKTINIKATKLLTDALSCIPATQLPLFVNEKTGSPWREDTFSHDFREIADLAGLPNHIFMHTRHSSILYLHRAGCTPAEIAAITGHSLKTINQMLENHYLETRDQEVADAAIEKLEKHRVRQKRKTKSQTN